MKKHERMERLDNRGVTLIEVIVSVLIVGLAFTPLIAGMSTAFKANQQTESVLYADNIASECVEKLKSINSINEIDGLFDVTHENDGFSLDDIEEGDRTYSVRVTYSEAGGDVNSTESYRSISNISGEDKAQVDEIGAKNDYFEMKQQAKYLIEDGSHSKDDPLDAAKHLTKKTTYVKLGYDATSAQPDKYYVSYHTEYEFDSNYFEEGKSELVTDEVKKTYFNIPQAVMLYMSSVMSVSGMNNSGSEISDALYEYTKKELAEAGKTIKEKGDYNNSTTPEEKLVFSNLLGVKTVAEDPGIDEDSQVEIYIFVADAKAGENNSGKLKLDLSSAATANNISVYCSTGINSSDEGSTFVLNEDLIREAEEDEIPKMYNVTVKVTNKSTGNVDSTVESTVVWNAN